MIVETTPLKFIARMNTSVLPESTPPDQTFKYIDIGSLSSDGVIRLPNDLTRFADAPSRARRIAPPGSTIISTVRTYLRAIGYVDVDLSKTAVFSTGFVVLEPKPAFDRRYFYYACRSEPFVEEIVSRSVGVSYPAIAPADLANIPVASPSISIQQKVADFLDDQVARIDEIIRLREQQIGALDDFLRSKITDAVTGANASGERTETHIPWLGSIPVNWRALPIKRVGRSLIGLTYGPDDTVESPTLGTLVLRSGNIQGSQISLEDNVYVSGRLPGRTITREGDVLICARNGSASLVGKSAVITPDVAGAAFGAFMTVLRSSMNDFLRWVLRTPIFTSQVGLFSTTTINQLTRETLENLVVPIPPAQEQSRISKDMVLVEQHTVGAQREIRAQIDLLRERKRALITAAVTSEFDVTTASGRGVA